MVKIARHCIRCGACIDLHPELFELDWDNDCIRVLDEVVKPEREAEVRDMIADCPVAAISIVARKQ